MQTASLLTKQIKSEIPSMHSSRLRSLIACTQSLISGKRLTLTALGREMAGAAKPRSNIRRVDRLLSNQHLPAEIPSIFSMVSHQLLTSGTSPVILIDWSCISSLHEHYLLRASVSVKGRSMVIYQELHAKSQENNNDTHISFLQALSKILPETVQPIIVTDAGFRAIWFHAVRELGFDFIGRVRNKNAVRLTSNDSWITSASLYDRATTLPQELGCGLLTQANPIHCRFICYKGLNKCRVNNTLKGTKKQGGKEKRYRRTSKEPWLLVTSLDLAKINARKVTEIYKKRMQIEEDFRDTKSSRYGFALEFSGTRSKTRMVILLMIAVLGLAAIVAHRRGIYADYQARSAKFKNSISYVYLGREVLLKRLCLSLDEYKRAICIFQQMASGHVL